MKLKICIAIMVLALVALSVAGCNSQSYAADDKSKIHVGIVFDIGGKDDPLVQCRRLGRSQMRRDRQMAQRNRLRQAGDEYYPARHRTR